jgi:cysteine desulfuration protein SufE
MQKIEIPNSCLVKQQAVIKFFDGCTAFEQKYAKIIEMGRQLAPYPIEYRTSERLVKGCQSTMYLHAQLINGKVHFLAFSEALISAGLAALLIAVYHDELPEAILSHPPRFLEELGIHNNLSPGRANGLASLFHRMKKEALDFLINNASCKNYIHFFPPD